MSPTGLTRVIWLARTTDITLQSHPQYSDLECWPPTLGGTVGASNSVQHVQGAFKIGTDAKQRDAWNSQSLAAVTGTRVQRLLRIRKPLAAHWAAFQTWFDAFNVAEDAYKRPIPSSLAEPPFEGDPTEATWLWCLQELIRAAPDSFGLPETRNFAPIDHLQFWYWTEADARYLHEHATLLTAEHELFAAKVTAAAAAEKKRKVQVATEAPARSAEGVPAKRRDGRELTKRL
jgi:hypothetical protein